jgi:hypothetical protein
MPKTALPEWLLARFVGNERAAVILGDLLEIATTRGRLWFWSAYARTLISLAWRTPLAFLCAYAFSGWIATNGFMIINSLRRHFLWNVHPYYPPAVWRIPLGDSILALWFILPFVLVQYGYRDRLTQLASAVFLLTLPYFSLTGAGINFAGLATAATILAAMCLNTWRRPMVVLAATVAPIVVAIILSPKLWYVLISRGYRFESPQLQRAMTLYRVGELCIAAIVCSFLYRRLLQKKPTDLSTLAIH